MSPYLHPTDGEKPQYVRQLFDQIADHYDALNHVISAGCWDRWHEVLQAATDFQPGDHVIDVACGTGGLTMMAAGQVAPSGSVTGVDFSEGMLSIARGRVAQTDYAETISLCWGDVMALPFPDNSFDGATMGWAMRNVQSIPKALSEIRRVLKPGGRFLCIDAAKPRATLIHWAFLLYWRVLLSAIDRLYLRVGQHTMIQPYTYLSRSLDHYPSPAELEMLFRDAGFGHTDYQLLMLGTVAIHSGVK